MSIISRLFTLVGSLLMGMLYFFPMWKIGLGAPQYPEGLSMSIWINQITGDVKNINILNHYIGMRAIVADQIPELKILPILFAVLILIGLVTCFVGKRKLLYSTTILFFVVAIASMADFYKWGYDYGHNLDPKAALKLEESYQPPLIGTKEILNISAESWPDTGGFAFAGTLFLFACASFYEFFTVKRRF